MQLGSFKKSVLLGRATIFFVPLHPMDIQSFFTSLLNLVCEMAPYLLLGFFIAGVLHVFVPQKFYANYLSRNNKLSVLSGASRSLLPRSASNATLQTHVLPWFCLLA